MSYKEGVDSIAHGGLGVLSSERLSNAIKENPSLKLTVRLSGKWFPDALSHNVIGLIRGKKTLKNSIEFDGHLYLIKAFSKLKIEMILKLKKTP